jgi:hypothetical protein
MYKHIETAYLHADSNDYGGEAVLNENPISKHEVFGTTHTIVNTVPRSSCGPWVTRSSRIYHSFEAATSSSTRITHRSSLPSAS